MTSRVLALAALAAALPALARAQTYGAPGGQTGAFSGPPLLQNQTPSAAAGSSRQGFGLANGRPGDASRTSDQGFGARGFGAQASSAQGYGGAGGYGARGAVDPMTGRRVIGAAPASSFPNGASALNPRARDDDRTPLPQESAPPSTILFIPALVPALAPPQISVTKPFRR